MVANPKEAYRKKSGNMSCITWLGRLATRFLITGGGGFHPAGEHYLAAIIPAERFIRRQISSCTSRSSSKEDSETETIRDSEAIARATRLELGRSAICRSLWTKWQDFRAGPGFVSVVSGLPKNFTSCRFRKGQFGDDAWFIARNTSADVIGMNNYSSKNPQILI